MAKEFEIRYSLDDDGEAYFPVTHIDAVLGLNFDNDDSLKTAIVNLQSKNNDLEQTIASLTKRIEKLESK